MKLIVTPNVFKLLMLIPKHLNISYILKVVINQAYFTCYQKEDKNGFGKKIGNRRYWHCSSIRR